MDPILQKKKSIYQREKKSNLFYFVYYIFFFFWKEKKMWLSNQKINFFWLFSCLIAINPLLVKATPAFNTGTKRNENEKHVFF